MNYPQSKTIKEVAEWLEEQGFAVCRDSDLETKEAIWTIDDLINYRKKHRAPRTKKQ